MPAFNLTWFLFGVVGGAIPDIIRIIKSRHDPDRLAYLKNPLFWGGFVLLLLLAGGAAWVFGASNVQSALAMGFSAPESISRVLGKAPPVDRDGRPVRYDLRGWWSV